MIQIAIDVSVWWSMRENKRTIVNFKVEEKQKYFKEREREEKNSNIIQMLMILSTKKQH